MTCLCDPDRGVTCDPCLVPVDPQWCSACDNHRRHADDPVCQWCEDDLLAVCECGLAYTSGDQVDALAFRRAVRFLNDPKVSRLEIRECTCGELLAFRRDHDHNRIRLADL